jgi:hypothetical protein
MVWAGAGEWCLLYSCGILANLPSRAASSALRRYFTNTVTSAWLVLSPTLSMMVAGPGGRFAGN